MTRGQWNEVLYKNWDVIILIPFMLKFYHVSLTSCQICKPLQDTLLTKLLGPFIEVHKSHFLQNRENLI